MTIEIDGKTSYYKVSLEALPDWHVGKGGVLFVGDGYTITKVTKE
ncbi:MAG: hypothetical protein ACI3ZO_01645 [Candidatus Cryptobacteroides sp.]|nr:hypothetical protein [Bacteroidales bacterium]